MAEVLSVLHVCLVHSQLAHSPTSTPVASTVPGAAPRTHLHPNKQQRLRVCTLFVSIGSHRLRGLFAPQACSRASAGFMLSLMINSLLRPCHDSFSSSRRLVKNKSVALDPGNMIFTDLSQSLCRLALSSQTNGRCRSWGGFVETVGK